MKLIGKIPVSVWFFLLLIWQILLTFQGLDLADTGFHLTAFRFIFNDPYSVQYSMMYWLSEVAGHFWMNMWPDGGLFWARLGWVVFVSTTGLVYYHMLSGVLDKRMATTGLGITLIFILLGGPECLNYDIFSTFGFALGIFFLYKALREDRWYWLFLSGLIFGMNVFFKLSNAAALAFLLIIPFQSYLKSAKIQQSILRILIWISAFGLGILLILLLIRLAGHQDLFFDNLKFVSSMSGDDRSSHGLKPMLLSYFWGYSNAIAALSAFVVLVWLCFEGTDRFPLFQRKFFSILLIAAVSLVVLVLMVFLRDPFWSKIRYLFLGLMLFQGIKNVVSNKLPDDLKLISLTGLILLFVVPLGSDSGLDKSVWGMWLLGPLLLAGPAEYSVFRISRFQNEFNTSELRKVFAITVLISGILHAWQTPYFDAGSRFQKIAELNHPKLNLIFTSEKRARVLNELMNEGFVHIQNERYLLSFIEIPMLNYLSDKTPFISTSWPKLYYNPEKFRIKLEEALQRRNEFPAIIRQKQNTMLNDWPGVFDANYFSYPENLSKWPVHGKILNEFIDRYNYQVVWENEMFQILIRKSGELN